MRFQKGFGLIVTMLQVSCARFANKIFFLVFCYSPLVRNGYEFSHIKFALIFKPRNVALRFLFEILSHNSVKFLWFTKYLPTYVLSENSYFEGYNSNQITKKEPKSDYRLSKFDWHHLSPIFLAIMLLHNLKVFQKPIKHHLLATYSQIQQ